MIVSGFISYIVDKSWFKHNSPIMKVPYFIILGVCLNFSLTLLLIDILNYIVE